MYMKSEELRIEGWEFLSDKNSGIDYFTRKYLDNVHHYVDGILVLSKPIDENYNASSKIKIMQYSLGGLYVYPIYVGGCSSIEEFRYICKLLKI